MSKKVRSARGVLVDFDSIQIKQQLADTPAPVEVKAREEFVDERLKRRARRRARQAARLLEGEASVAEIVDSVDDDVEEQPQVEPTITRKQPTPKRT